MMFGKFGGGGSASGGTGCAVLVLAAGLLALAVGQARADAPVHGNWPEVQPERVERDARVGCARHFPDSYSMQATCLDVAREGAQEFREILRRSSDDPGMLRALAKCLRDLTRDGVPDHGLIGVCARVELEARDRLRG